MILASKKILSLVSAIVLFSLSIHAQPVQTPRATSPPSQPVSPQEPSAQVLKGHLLYSTDKEYIGLPMPASKYVLFHPELKREKSNGVVIVEPHPWILPLSDLAEIIRKKNVDVKHIENLLSRLKLPIPTMIDKIKGISLHKTEVAETVTPLSGKEIPRRGKLGTTIFVHGLQIGSYTTQVMFVPKELVEEKLQQAYPAIQKVISPRIPPYHNHPGKP